MLYILLLYSYFHFSKTAHIYWRVCFIQLNTVHYIMLRELLWTCDNIIPWLRFCCQSQTYISVLKNNTKFDLRYIYFCRNNLFYWDSSGLNYKSLTGLKTSVLVRLRTLLNTWIYVCATACDTLFLWNKYVRLFAAPCFYCVLRPL